MIVIKVGGRSLANLGRFIIPDLVGLKAVEKVILVHGGANVVTDLAKRLGKEQRFITSPEGVRSRYTDKEDMEVYVMVMAGSINKKVVLELNRAGLTAVGMSGLEGGTLRASRKDKLLAIDERGRKIAIEGGYTGKLQAVEPKLIMTLINEGYLPVVSPIAMGDEFEPLNVDSDAVAAMISTSVRADRLIFMTDVDGVEVEGNLVREISILELDDLLRNVGPGMDRKLIEAKRAISSGVTEAIITQSSIERPIRRAINHEVGTVIHP